MLPVWMMKGRVIIGISSPRGKTNHFSKLFFARYPDTGLPVFNTLIFEGCCKKCRETGKDSTCDHEPWRFPTWLTPNTKMEAIRLTLESDVDTFRREQRGIITEELTGAYVPFKYVERLKNAEPFDSAHHRQPSWLIIACDPNSGGSSDTAIVALTVVKGLIVILGLEAFPCEDPAQIATLFAYFIEKLYGHPWLRNCICVLFVERNVSAGPYVLEKIMKEKCPKHYVITDQVREVSGWWTDRAMKSEYVISGATQMREDKICFLKDMVCENPWLPYESRGQIMRNKLLEQIPRFRIKEPSENSRRVTPIITGKLDENGKKVKGVNDDLALAFFMGLYFIEGISQETIPGLNYQYIKQEGK